MNISFNINFDTVWGQKLYIVGSVPELGVWDKRLARGMTYINDGHWQLQLNLPDSAKFVEYRYFLSVNDQPVFEEWDKNHLLVPDKHIKKYVLYDHWQDKPGNLVFYSSAFTKSLFAHSCDTPRDRKKEKRTIVLKISAARVEKTQRMAIVGNQEYVGCWDPYKALALHCGALSEWFIELDADMIRYPLEYKFLLIDADTHAPVSWEPGENRVLNLPVQEEQEMVCVSGLHFREERPPWKCAGTVVPVFSLRSEKSFGVGDLGDLKMFIDWIKMTGQRFIQILPVNDTISSGTWADSYPYSAISIYALHPMYIDLQWMGVLKDNDKASFFEERRVALNAGKTVDYVSVVKYKLEYCRLFFEQEGKQLLETGECKKFLVDNKQWLVPYAAFCYFRGKYGSTDFSQWEEDAVYNKTRIEKLGEKESEAYPEISFVFFIQFVLHTQFKEVSDYARRNGIVLKGDLPIGVNKSSVEVWTEPYYFNTDGQSGAPPDDFSMIGQNWRFPTYNWTAMEKNNYSWWKKRFAKLADYFDCFRIDHILGFFRIWEIPIKYIQGLCGHFNPALPLSKEEIEQCGIIFDERHYTTPHISEKHLPELFGEHTNKVKEVYLEQLSPCYFTLKPFCNTQTTIEALFAGKPDRVSQQIKEGLFCITNEVLFLRDPYVKNRFHPRISASQSYLYRELSDSDRHSFDHLYWDFFYHRHNAFWKAQALKKLTPLVDSTEMLVCGEDLGMIPDPVPDVMNRLQILSLEIERMPKKSNREFADLSHLPYLSVCTTSTHDMPPIRNWWKEDRAKTQRYYNEILDLPGNAPDECTAEIALQIVENHLNSPSMLTILPIQDWFATDDWLKKDGYEEERINIPANPTHYWRYRIHVTIEKLMKADSLNKKIISLTEKSGRK